MRSLCLTVARFVVAAWVGAAVLFVVTGVREVRSPLDSVTRDVLVAIRFPPYYLFGFSLVGAGWLCALVARRHPAVPRPAGSVALVLLTAALGLTALDYLLVYRHLAEAVQPPGQARPTWFTAYHKASMWANAAQILCCLTAAFLLSWPARQAARGEKG